MRRIALFLALSSAAYAQDPKLTYPQDTAVKYGTKTMNGYDKDVAKFAAGYEKLKANPDTAFVMKNAGNAALAVADMETKLENILADLKKNAVPDTHSQVVALRERIDKMKVALAEQKAKFEALKGGMAKAADLSSYPDYQKDCDEADRITKACTIESFRTDPVQFKRLLDVNKDRPAFTQWCADKSKAYDPLIRAGTAEAKTIKAKLDGAGRAMDELNRQADGFIRSLGNGGRERLETANKVLKVTATEKKSHYFQGDGMGLKAANDVQENITILKALVGADDATVKELTAAHEKLLKDIEEVLKTLKEQGIADLHAQILEKLAEAEKGIDEGAAKKNPGSVNHWRQTLEQIAKRVEGFTPQVKPDDPRLKEQGDRMAAAKAKGAAAFEALRTEITAATRAPEEKYAGGEKEELRKKILSKWKEVHPKDEVLQVRFHMEAWKRTVEWSWVGDSLKKYDYSVLIATVIVKTSDTVATLYRCELFKDHMQGDTLKVGVNTKGGVWITDEMLLSNLK